MTVQEAFDFTGKTIVVAGASSGIGRATAIRLSELGAKVVILARREEQLKETLSMMHGDHNRYYLADFMQLDTIEPLFKQIVSENGSLFGLIYCAGTGKSGSIRVIKPNHTESIMKTNFLAFYEMVRAFSRKGYYVEGARIVGMSSIASRKPNKEQSIYAATKSAMDAFVRCAAQELSEKGITINTLQPGWVNTGMLDHYLSANENGTETLKETQPMGAIEPEEVADTVVFLLSAMSQKITGTGLAISAGQAIV